MILNLLSRNEEITNTISYCSSLCLKFCDLCGKAQLTLNNLLCYCIDEYKWPSLMNHNLHTLLTFYVGMFTCDNERNQKKLS